MQALLQGSHHRSHQLCTYTSIKGAVHLQELKSKLESWRGDGWLEQCCTSLAEQLRIAQAENTDLQQELEALR